MLLTFEELCELIAQNFVSISFLIARNPEQSGPLYHRIYKEDLVKLWTKYEYGKSLS